MDKETIEKILSMFPDDAEVEAEFSFVNTFNTTYRCNIEGLNLKVNPDNSLSATLRLVEKKNAA